MYPPAPLVARGAPQTQLCSPYFCGYGAPYEQQREAESAAYRARHIESIDSEDDEMVYDWDGKEATCFQMYIEENKSLEEIMQWFKEKQNFAPR